jgi:hypothetical protein
MHKNDGKLMERLKDQKRRSRTRSSSGPSSSTRSRTLSARSRTASVAVRARTLLPPTHTHTHTHTRCAEIRHPRLVQGRSRTRSKSEGLASRAKVPCPQSAPAARPPPGSRQLLARASSAARPQPSQEILHYLALSCTIRPI